jgi:hypothetical protein
MISLKKLVVVLPGLANVPDLHCPAVLTVPDLADTAHDEGDCAEEFVSASSVDRRAEAGACELGILL